MLGAIPKEAGPHLTEATSDDTTPDALLSELSEGSDIFLLSGPLTRLTVERVYEACASAPGRSKCLLVLTTLGGDADAAYIIARYLRRRYDHFTVYVFGLCKSAGTLLALGAEEIVMGERGELGPIDIQVTSKDELSLSSGLEFSHRSKRSKVTPSCLSIVFWLRF